ncbi:MAG: alpha-amylase family glycosyl hydrolase [Myxococcota bacterium]|nr:alpha-amylase family glycosyl hydrolase [Myxococcota bacterium]
MLLTLLACSGAPTPPATAVPASAPAPVYDAIYLAMVDRFRDGAESPHAVAPDDPQGWHGGDLAGVVQELDRLQDLGIQQLWLTPLQASRQAPFHQWGAYHGYWPSDWNELEPRFGSWDDVEALRAGLDERGMSLVLDMVYNHTEFDHPLRQTHPHWFHPERTIENWADPDEVLTGQVHGLPDLDQRHPEVAEFLTDATLLWLEKTGARAIRVDAVRHIHPEFIQNLMASVKARSTQEVTWIGEIFEGDPVKLNDTWRASGLEEVFDFPLHYALLDTVCGEADATRLASILSMDRLYPDPNRLITFLDNHDRPRFASTCGVPGQTEDALRLLIGLRGRNSWTWGTEAGALGAHEPENRATVEPHQFLGPTADSLREAIAFRAAAPVLREGLSALVFLDSDTSVWLRVHERSSALVIFSKSQRSDLELPEWIHDLTPKAQLGEVALTSNTLEVGEGSSILLLEDSQAAGEFFDSEVQRQATPEFVSVHFNTEKEGALSGAGPEFGNWDTSQALPIGEEGLSIEVPAGTVLSFKRLHFADGELQWESGPNRTYWVNPASPSHVLNLDTQ